MKGYCHGFLFKFSHGEVCVVFPGFTRGRIGHNTTFMRTWQQTTLTCGLEVNATEFRARLRPMTTAITCIRSEWGILLYCGSRKQGQNQGRLVHCLSLRAATRHQTCQRHFVAQSLESHCFPLIVYCFLFRSYALVCCPSQVVYHSLSLSALSDSCV